MKERPNLDEVIEEIQKMIDASQRNYIRYINVGTLMDILYLLKEKKATNPAVDVNKCNCRHKLEDQQPINDNVLFHEQLIQEAKKPIYNEEKYGDHLPHCPSCEKVLPDISKYRKVKFCPRCGQEVKWTDLR